MSHSSKLLVSSCLISAPTHTPTRLLFSSFYDWEWSHWRSSPPPVPRPQERQLPKVSAAASPLLAGVFPPRLTGGSSRRWSSPLRSSSRFSQSLLRLLFVLNLRSNREVFTNGKQSLVIFKEGRASPTQNFSLDSHRTAELDCCSSATTQGKALIFTLFQSLNFRLLILKFQVSNTL